MMELERRMANPKLRTSIDHITDGSKLYFVDTETSGVAQGDMVRSVSIREGTLGPSTTGSGRSLQVAGPEDIGARFNTPGMSAYVSADPNDLTRVTSYGDTVITRETDLGGSMTASLPKMDLASPAGRTAAAKFYKDKFQKFSEGDAFFVAYNAKFDVNKLMDSARAIPEFMEDPSAVALLKKFQTRMFQEGGMIDVLQMAKSSLNDQVAERMKAATLAGDDAGIRALKGMESLLSGRSLYTAGQIGEGVKPFGLENILESTNLLESLARSGGAEEMGVIERLASSSASHIDEMDNTVTRLLLRQMVNGDGIKLLDPSGSHTSGISPEVLAKIERARINVAGAKAMTSTTNIADPRYLTERSLEYLYSNDEALKKVQIEDTFGVIDSFRAPGLTTSVAPADQRGILSLKPDEDGIMSYQFTTSEGSSIRIADQTAQDYIRAELSAIRAKSPDVVDTLADTSPRSSVVLSTGINPVQQTNINNVRDLFASGTVSPISVGEGIDPLLISRSIAENEETFLAGTTATGNITGFTEGAEPMSESGLSGVVRHPLESVSQASAKKYNQVLNDAGIVSASMNPTARSAVVSLSAATSNVGAQNSSLIAGALLSEQSPTGALIARTATDVAGRVNAATENVSRIMPLLSDLAIVHTKTQKLLSVSESVVAVPFSVIQKMETLDESGTVISMAEGLKLQKARLSVAQRSKRLTPTVNVVVGGSIGDKAISDSTMARAKREAESLYDALEGMTEMKTPRAMVEAGLAESEQAAINIRTQFAGFDISQRTRVVEELTKNISERGIIIGGLSEQLGGTEAVAQDAAQILDKISGGADNDLLFKQLVGDLGVGGYDESGISLAVKLPDEVLSESTRIGGAVGNNLIERSSPTNQVKLLQGAIRRSVDDPDFINSARRAQQIARPNEEISAHGTAITRRLRDMDIREKMRYIKPKAYKSAIAVGALSAGYYIARRGQKDNLYDQVMEEQDFEPGPLSVSDFNDVDQQLANQTSSRRDPLVTAGVVGNLDRNKSSHYKMGTDKYNHLFGA